MNSMPDLSFSKLWNISFGFFGIQIAYALQSANISRIFSTLGADPHSLSYFWILPPLMGIIVQPIVGIFSDKTWTRFGRRIPYLFIGAVVAVFVMFMLPNAGSFGMSVQTAMIFGLASLMFLDTSINMAMQPFKMMVRRYGKRKAKRSCLLDSKLFVQRRQPCRLLIPVYLCHDRNKQRRSPRSDPRFGHLLFLHRRRDFNSVRYLYNP